MEQSKFKAWSLLRLPDGPLAPHIYAFSVWLSEQGFTRRSVGPKLRLVAKFSGWLKTESLDLTVLADEQVDRFLRLMEPRKSVRAGGRMCLGRLMTYLRLGGVINQQAPAPAVEATSIQRVVIAFEQHLRHAQGLSHATCVQYVPFAQQFLAERFGNGPVELCELRAVDVVGFIKRQAARLSQVRAKSATIALRSFLRYLRMHGDIALDLAASVPTVPNWSMTGIPRAMATDDLHAVLQSCRRDTASGCGTTRSCCCWLVWAFGPVRSFH